MKEFHCIVGNKGGVGKSLAASWIIQYAEDQRWGPFGIECDQSNRTLSRYERLRTQRLELLDREQQIDRRRFDALIEMLVQDDEPFVVMDNGQASFAPLTRFTMPWTSWSRACMTDAFPRVERRVQEGFAAIVGIPRGVYRGAKKRAASARKHANDPQQVNTYEYVSHRIHDGADKLHRDPFTTIGHRLKKNAVRAAIELLPDAQQRQVLRLMYVDGLAQSEVCEVLQLSKTRISRFHSGGVETVQKLLLLESALEQKYVVHSVAQLSERRPREVLLALYRSRRRPSGQSSGPRARR